jgi:ADP-ribose pyrophosphatase YjhB (NUDIX family)
MNTFRIRVTGLLIEANKILVLEQKTSDRKYTIPGGGVEIDETLEQALVREFKEETGLTIKPNRILYISEYNKDANTHVIEIVFTVSRVDKTEKIVLGNEPGSSDHVISNYKIIPINKLVDIGRVELASLLSDKLTYGQYRGLRDK